MKKDKKFLNDLENALGDINSKYKNEVILKYTDKINEEKNKKRKITEILKELGDPKEIANNEIENYKSKSFINKVNYNIKSIFNKNKKEKKVKEKKVKEKKVKEPKEKKHTIINFLTKDISFNKKKDKIKVDEVLEDVVNDIQDEIGDVSEVVTEKKIFESKEKRNKRILLKSLGIILTSLLLFIWLWISVVFIASIFAYLDGVKFIGLNIALFGLDILVLWIVIMVNRAIFKKENNLRLNLIIVIVSVLLIALGIVLFLRKIYKVESVNDVTTKYTMTNKISTYNLPSNEDEKFYITFNSNYKTQYMIDYDDTLDDKVKLEVKYFECYYDYNVKKTSNSVYVSLALDDRDRLSVYIDDLKEGKVFNNDELSRYSVKISIHPDQIQRLVIND